MSRKIFVNLPVKDLPAAKEFFSKLGFSFNAQFTNDAGACLVIGENIYAMLLTHDHFRNFAKTAICDTSKGKEVMTALSCESREEVDSLVKKALAAGGTAPNPPQDHGFMYGHGFQDLDGHTWEFFWMDPNHVKPES